MILFWHGCWSLLDAWSESLGLDHTISSWYAVVRKISGERKIVPLILKVTNSLLHKGLRYRCECNPSSRPVSSHELLQIRRGT